MGIPLRVTCQATRHDGAAATAVASPVTHHYRAYGLAIASAVPLPQLAPTAPAAADLTIEFGAVGGERLSLPGFRRWEIRNQFRYVVEEGSRIVIDRLPGSTDEDISDLVMSRVLTAAIYQRGLLPLHASAVMTERGIVALCGPSGVGKSTLAGVLAARGGVVIADDMLVLGEQGDVAGHGAVGLKLSVPALARLGRTADGLALSNSVEHKFFLPVGSAGSHDGRIAVLAQLRLGDGAVAPLSPAAATAGWRACIRMPDLMPEAPDQGALWRRWLDLVLGSANLSVAHGGRMDALDDIASALERAPHETGQPRSRP